MRVSDNDIIKVKDTSGYGYDGIITGSLTLEVSSPRYNRDTKFGGHNCYFLAIFQKNCQIKQPENIFLVSGSEQTMPMVIRIWRRTSIFSVIHSPHAFS